MKTKWYKNLSLLVAITMIISMMPVYAASAEIDPQNAIVHFVNHDAPTALSSMASYMKNGKTYTKDGETYLRIDVKQVYDVTFLLEDLAGEKVDEYEITEVNSYTQKETTVTYFTYDYEISEVTNVLEGSVSYNQPPTGSSLGGLKVHNVFVVINNDITAVRAELTTVIAEAKEVVSPTGVLQAAITAAEKANNYITKKVDMAAALDALRAAFINPVNAIVHFINYDEPTKISSMATYLKNGKTYTKDEHNYLRVDVKQEYDVTFLLEGLAGTKVDEYVVKEVNARTKVESDVTYYTYDYVVSDVAATLEGKVSYFVPGVFTDTQVHSVYVVINNDIDAVRAELTTVIGEAKEIVSPSGGLQAAITAAEKANNYMTKKVDMAAALDALKTAITNNGTGGSTPPAGNDTTTPPVNAVIHTGSGLEVGKYEIGVTVLKDNSDEASYMNSSVDGIARLSVTKDKLTVYVVLHDASMIQSLTIGSKSASIANKYTADNVARYSFEVSTLTKPTEANVHVIATLPDGSLVYDTKHGIRFAFDGPYKVDKWEDEGYVNKVVNGDVVTVLPETIETDKDIDTGSASGEANGNNNGGTTNPSTTFTDIDHNWAKAAIERAVSLKLVNGYSDGSFKPNQEVNRAEFTAILVRAMKLDVAKGEVKFTDADKIQGWAKQYIQQAVEAGILTGYSDNTFRPTGNITRTEAAVMIVKALGLELVSEEELTFADASSIPAYARAYVATAVKYGLVAGYTNNTFGPTNVATRADAITLALRALDYSVRNQ